MVVRGDMLGDDIKLVNPVNQGMGQRYGSRSGRSGGNVRVAQEVVIVLT
jgi:hypothetical protein